MSNKIFAVLRTLVGIGLLWFLFILIDFNQFLETIKNAKIWPLVAVIAIYFSGLYISALRWNNILKYYKILSAKSQLISLYLIGGFFNNFLPTSIGGDTYKYIYMKKKYPTLNKEVLSSIIIERGFGFLTLFIVNIILIFPFMNLVLSKTPFLIIEAIIIFSFLFLMCTILCKDKMVALLEKVKIEFTLFQKFKKFIKLLTGINEKKLIVVSFIYSIFFVILCSLSLFLVFHSLGYQINIFYILFVSSIANIFRVLPISLNSIGVTEGLYVFLFWVYGVESEVSLAVAIIARILLMLGSSSGGVAYLLGGFKK